MKFGYDGTGFLEVASGASKYAALAVSTSVVSRLDPGVYGLPLPVLFAALVGALLSLLFMEPLEGKKRRFLPATILTFALIGASATIVVQALIAYAVEKPPEIPAPVLALILGFLGHRLIPLLLVDGPAAIAAAVKARFAKWRGSDA
jgi:hypothetical protein